MAATESPPSGNVFDVMHDVTAILDRLNADEKKQVMAFLASRYGLTIKEPPAPKAGGMRRSHKRSY